MYNLIGEGLVSTYYKQQAGMCAIVVNGQLFCYIVTESHNVYIRFILVVLVVLKVE